MRPVLQRLRDRAPALAPGLERLLQMGFVAEGGRYLLASEARAVQDRSWQSGQTATDDEAFINHIHIEDELGSSAKDEELLEQAMLFASRLADALADAYPAATFRVIMHTNTYEEDPELLGWVVRFHRLRENQVPWPTADVADYPEPLLVLTAGA
jgi:hypothetical protein